MNPKPVTKRYRAGELPLEELLIGGGNGVGRLPSNLLSVVLRGRLMDLRLSTSKLGINSETTTSTYGILLDRDAVEELRNGLDNFLKQMD